MQRGCFGGDKKASQKRNKLWLLCFIYSAPAGKCKVQPRGSAVPKSLPGGAPRTGRDEMSPLPAPSHGAFWALWGPLSSEGSGPGQATKGALGGPALPPALPCAWNHSCLGVQNASSKLIPGNWGVDFIFTGERAPICVQGPVPAKILNGSGFLPDKTCHHLEPWLPLECQTPPPK